VKVRAADALFGLLYFTKESGSPHTGPRERKRRAELLAQGRFPAQWRLGVGRVIDGECWVEDGQLRFLQTGTDPTTFLACAASLRLAGRGHNWFGRTSRLILDCGEREITLFVPRDECAQIMTLIPVTAAPSA
jgi:hypothetical protein